MKASKELCCDYKENPKNPPACVCGWAIDAHTACVCGWAIDAHKMMNKILDKERKEFFSLWHSYHAKYKIPYSHDEMEKIFNSIVLIFKESK